MLADLLVGLQKAGYMTDSWDKFYSGPCPRCAELELALLKLAKEANVEHSIKEGTPLGVLAQWIIESRDADRSTELKRSAELEARLASFEKETFAELRARVKELEAALADAEETRDGWFNECRRQAAQLILRDKK